MDYGDVIEDIKKWLGAEGINHFRQIKQLHGKVNAVYMMEGTNVPYCVHFREGMQVRNKLRELTDNKWTSHEYDDRWVNIVEEAIK